MAIRPLLALTLLVAALPAQAKLSRHPYVQLATQHSIHIVWRTTTKSTPVVRVGRRPDRLSTLVPNNRIRARVAPRVKADRTIPRLHSAPDGTWQFEAHVQGLEADQRYYYAVFAGEQKLAGGDADHSFRTLPLVGPKRRARFWVVGDSGTGLGPPKQVFRSMRDFVKRDGVAIDGYLHVGDMAYGAGTDAQFTTKFFAIYTELLRNTVCWPAMGNHEGHTARGMTGLGPYYDGYVLPTKGEAGGVPSGKEAFYSFDFANIHFICLDSYDLSRKPDGEMAVWLRADLEQTKQAWILAYWHHPPYTKGTHDSDREIELVEMREHIMPILEAGGVDVVLSGHSHIYERSMLIDGAYVTPTTTRGVILDDGDGDPSGTGAYRKSAGLLPHRGTVAVVAGNGGTTVGKRATMPIMRSIFVEHGSVILDVDGDTLTSTMLNSKGKVRDVFQLVKRGTVPTKIIDEPWDARGPRIDALADEFSSPQVVTIAARPNAPDAKIHYTTDGSEPTLTSPIYRGPILIGKTMQLKAISVWKNGSRISPVRSRRFFALPPNFFMRRITHRDDDVEQTAAGRILPRQNRLELGYAGKKRQLVGLRFANLDIPRGTKIKTAFVQFAARLKSQQPAKLRVYVPTAGDCSPFGRAPYALSRLIDDAPFVTWDCEPWTHVAEQGPLQRTPDLRALLQKVIDHPHWDPGQAIAVVVEGSGTRVAAAFDRSKPHAPVLWVEVER